MRINTTYLIFIIVVSIIYTSGSVYLALNDASISEGTNFAWTIAFALIIALWTKNDSITQKFDKPFEFSYLVFIFWPFFLPYYLIKTRGIEGLILFFGFASLYYLPFTGVLIAYGYFYE